MLHLLSGTGPAPSFRLGTLASLVAVSLAFGATVLHAQLSTASVTGVVRDPSGSSVAGARLVLTHGLTVRPRSTAFFARMPAAIMTDGFEVLVQLVIAAMTTAPCPRSYFVPLLRTLIGLLLVFACLSSMLASDFRNTLFDWLSVTRSCGRRGPARRPLPTRER